MSFKGVTFPAINVMMAAWILPAERAKFTTIVSSGKWFILFKQMFNHL